MAWSLEGPDVLGQLEWAAEQNFGAVAFHTTPTLAPERAIDPGALGDAELVRLQTALKPFESIEIHAPFGPYDVSLVSPNPWIRLASMETLRESVELAGAIKARVVTVHTGHTLAAVPRETLRPLLLESLQLLEELAKEHNVTVGVETADALGRAEDLAIIEKANLAHVGVTLDIGHLCFQIEGRPAYAAFGSLAGVIERFGPLIRNIHLHDYDGTHDHLALGEGNIDFAAVIGALRRVDYDGPVCLEINVERSGVEGFLRSRDRLAELLGES